MREWENKKNVSLDLKRLYEHTAGKKIALMTNHSALDNRGKYLLDVMHFEWRLKILFALGMEHGLRGEQFAAAPIPSQRDTNTGIEVYSLYDFPELKPPVELLSKVDAVVFSAQDVGIRHWTYTPWMIFLIETAAKAGCEVIILDRPNPLGGNIVEGAVTERQYFSILGAFDYPLRHGMTIGELALMYNDRYSVGCNLSVIPMDGYFRDMWYEDTGMLWVPPSPNIPTPDTILGFATTGLMQSSNLNLGIGTATPFLLIGAPWLNGTAIAEKINALELPGLFCLNKYYIPVHGIYAGETLNGVYLVFHDREKYRPVTAQIHILNLIGRDYPNSFVMDVDKVLCDMRIGSYKLRSQLNMHTPAKQIADDWSCQAARFYKDRSKYLLYW